MPVAPGSPPRPRVRFMPVSVPAVDRSSGSPGAVACHDRPGRRRARSLRAAARTLPLPIPAPTYMSTDSRGTRARLRPSPSSAVSTPSPASSGGRCARRRCDSPDGHRSGEYADSIDDRRAETERRSNEADRRAEELRISSIEGLSTKELSQAAQDLQVTQARLPAAQAEQLDDARAALEATQREAAIVASRLQDATDLRGSLTATVTTGRADEKKLRAAVGVMAREARGAPGVSALDVMLDAHDATEFLDHAQRVDTALRSQSRILDELREVGATNRNSEARLSAVTDRVAELKQQAEANVVAADEARRVAQSREEEITRLIAEQSARQDAIASLKAQAEAEAAEIDAERATIERELVAIIAEQRAAREAAEAAARAAEAAARAAAEAAARAAAEAAGREPPPAPTRLRRLLCSPRRDRCLERCLPTRPRSTRCT